MRAVKNVAASRQSYNRRPMQCDNKEMLMTMFSALEVSGTHSCAECQNVTTNYVKAPNSAKGMITTCT